MSNGLQKRLIVAGVVAILVGVSRTAYGVVAGILITPSATVIQGNGYLAAADISKNTDAIASYKWELQRTYPKCAVPKVVISKDQSVSRYCELPVPQQLTLTTTYARNSSGSAAPAPTVHNRNITVIPVDGATIIAGDGVKMPNRQSQILIWQVKAGGTNAGPELGGMAQKRWTDQDDFTGIYMPDSNWSPITADDSFRLIDSRIFDEEGIFFEPSAWNSIPIGGMVTQGVIHLRLLWIDPCGNRYQISLGRLGIRHRKVSPDWYVIEPYIPYP